MHQSGLRKFIGLVLMLFLVVGPMAPTISASSLRIGQSNIRALPQVAEDSSDDSDPLEGESVGDETDPQESAEPEGQQVAEESSDDSDSLEGESVAGETDPQESAEPEGQQIEDQLSEESEESEESEAESVVDETDTEESGSPERAAPEPALLGLYYATEYLPAIPATATIDAADCGSVTWSVQSDVTVWINLFVGVWPDYPQYGRGEFLPVNVPNAPQFKRYEAGSAGGTGSFTLPHSERVYIVLSVHNAPLGKPSDGIQATKNVDCRDGAEVPVTPSVTPVETVTPEVTPTETPDVTPIPDQGQSRVVLQFELPGAIDIADAPYSLYAPMASQQFMPEPYSTGVVGSNNTIELINLIPGKYRLVVAPTGMEPIALVFTIGDNPLTELMVQLNDQGVLTVVNTTQVEQVPQYVEGSLNFSCNSEGDYVASASFHPFSSGQMEFQALFKVYSERNVQIGAFPFPLVPGLEVTSYSHTFALPPDSNPHLVLWFVDGSGSLARTDSIGDCAPTEPDVPEVPAPIDWSVAAVCEGDGFTITVTGGEFDEVGLWGFYISSSSTVPRMAKLTAKPIKTNDDGSTVAYAAHDGGVGDEVEQLWRAYFYRDGNDGKPIHIDRNVVIEPGCIVGEAATDPDVPTTPEEPITPDVPETPVKPEAPVTDQGQRPAQPSEAATTATGLPSTGHASHQASNLFAISMAILAGLAFAIAFGIRRSGFGRD